MAIKKIGENLNFSPETNLMSPKEALADEQIAKRFVKLAKKLKRIAPKANDFLYGHAIMMHAAEAALINQETGDPILNSRGEPVKGCFTPIKVNGQDSVKWESADGIKPYKNHNGDIFGESELIKAHKHWVGKPLCKDHKSDSVDGIRGIIIDTYYDPKFKRVHALFALDKKNYPDLARKVETGYANCVSMGTAVGRSVCTECGHVARTERDYCHHVRGRTNYGEVNLDLSPIELSLVVNGADGLAKIRNIVASLQNYASQKQERIDELLVGACVNPTELQALADNINEMQTKLNALMKIEQTASKKVEAFDADTAKSLTGLMKQIQQYEGRPDADPAVLEGLKNVLRDMLATDEGKETDEAPKAMPATGGGSEPSVSPMAGGGEGTYRTTTTPLSGVGNEPMRMASIEGDEDLGVLSNELRLLRSKVEKLSKTFNELKTVSKEDTNMNSARLRARAKARRAYWLGGGGVNEPTPGKPKYEKEDYETIRDKEDKQMVGEPLETGSEGLHPGDEGKTWETRLDGKSDKKAELEERKMKRKALLDQVQAPSEDNTNKLTEAELEERRMKRRAYWLGGGGVNEPTPGKPKYEKEDYETTRDKEDKQMVGEPLETGSEGLHPGDEPLKKKWLRARLRAKFTKVADNEGNLVKDASRWDIFAGDKLILTATGKEIFDDQLDENWDYLSSENYGKDVIRHIRTDGFDHVAYLLKGAQDPLAPAGADPLAPAPAAPEPAGEAAPAAPEGEPAPEPKAEEEPELKEKVESSLTKIESAIEEVRKAVGEGGEKLVDIEVKVDEEAGAESPMEQALASRNKLMEVHALLDESADELALVSEALNKVNNLEDESKNKILTAAHQALEDSNAILSQAEELVLAKKEDKEEKDEKGKEDKKDDDKEEDKKDKKDEKDEDKKDEKDEDKEDKKAAKLLEDALRLRAENRAALLARAMGDMDMEYAEDYELSPQDEDALKKLLEEERYEKGPEGELMHPDLAKDKDEEEEDDKKDEDDKEECAEDHVHDESCAYDAGLGVEEDMGSVMAARKSERDALVAQAEGILGKYELDLGKAENATEPTYYLAHPGGKGTVTELSHTKTEGARVESLSEVHDVMRDVAESGPRNVREAAALIQEQIVKGAFKAEDIDNLVAEGKVDSEAASYWKKYFGQAPDSGSFGADMSKEFAAKKSEAGNQEYKTKLRRAYAVGLNAQEKGLIASTQNALESYVDQIMEFDDAAFESNKRVVANYNSAKKNSPLPRVGTDGVAQSMTVTASPEATAETSLNEKLAQLDWR